MAIEARRGCGFRKVGGLYMVGSGFGTPCDRLPYILEVCPCCGAGIKQTRGWTWVTPELLFGGNHTFGSSLDKGESLCRCKTACPLCHNVKGMGKAGLLWVGAQFYPTIEHFEAEAKALGVSRRITAIPRDFEMGKTWILFAHPRGVIKATGELTAAYVPAIFRVWKTRPAGAHLQRVPARQRRSASRRKARYHPGVRAGQRQGPPRQRV